MDDRIPVTDQSQQIIVSLGPTELPLSEDRLYQQIEFDRSQSLAAPSAADQAEQDILEMNFRGGMGGGMGVGTGGGN